MLALLGGLLAGLARLGWDVPLPRPGFSSLHGPLMVSGFLGTLISLERAVALGRPWAYAAPLLSGLGGMALLVGLPLVVAQCLLLAGSVGLGAIFLAILQRHQALYTMTMAVGSGLWIAGNLLWLAGWPIFQVVFWWAAFLLVTIAGERLELARLQQLTRSAQTLFLFLIGVLFAGLLMLGWSFTWGVRLFGAGLFGLAWWLGRYDIARRTVRQPGLTRFIAVCLLTGYVWLGISGVSAMLFGGVPVGPQYDAPCLFSRFRVCDDLRPCADHLSGGARRTNDLSAAVLCACDPVAGDPSCACHRRCERVGRGTSGRRFAQCGDAAPLPCDHGVGAEKSDGANDDRASRTIVMAEGTEMTVLPVKGRAE